MEQELDYFTQTRIGVLIDVATKKFVAEVAQLKEKVDLLEREVSKLKTTSIASPQPARTIEFPKFDEPMPQQSSQQQQPRPVMQQQPQQRPQTQDVPRYGNYTSNDVSIEKFFNFGRRK